MSHARSPHGTALTASSSPVRRVLIVEDDHTCREFLRVALGRRGFQVALTESVPAAQETLSREGFDSYDCVVTDYRMPGFTGLDLLNWLKERRSSLATIMLTAEGEKRLVAESLRGGAADFLEKPVDLDRLREAIGKAIEQTHRQRRAVQMESAVKELGRAQQWMLKSHSLKTPVGVDIAFRPKLDAGGDFFSHFQPSANKYCCMLTDVSGHDLQAAYISAFFQGVVRGMVERGAPLPEVFASFNRFLLEEWNQSERGDTNLSTSVAVCSLLVDFAESHAEVLTCGGPAPIYVEPSGRAGSVGRDGGFPLGWFADHLPPCMLQPVQPGGAFLVWTDGLTDLAEKQGMASLSLGWAMQWRDRRDPDLAFIKEAADDILLVNIRLPAPEAEADPLVPIILDRYHGGQLGEIDALEDSWLRSLLVVIPDLPERMQHDILLACREAVLNALRHGCRGQSDSYATLQLSWRRHTRMLRVWIDDPGSGHDFDYEEQARRQELDLVDNHRGLIFIHNLAHHVTTERRGATLILDFQL